MDVYDLIMLSVVAVGTLFGAWKGLAWQVASLASIIASGYIAYEFHEPLAQMMNGTPTTESVSSDSHDGSPRPSKQENSGESTGSEAHHGTAESQDSHESKTHSKTFLAMLILFLGSSLAIWLIFRFVSDAIERVKLKEFDHHAGAVLGFCRGIVWCVIITLFAVTLLGEAQKKAIIESRSGYYIALLLDRSCPMIPEQIHDVIGEYIHSLGDTLAEEERTSHRHDDSTAAGAKHPEYNADTFAPANISDEPTSDNNEADDAIERYLRRFPEPEVRFKSQFNSQGR